jgi:nicotinamidase-related amidase
MSLSRKSPRLPAKYATHARKQRPGWGGGCLCGEPTPSGSDNTVLLARSVRGSPGSGGGTAASHGKIRRVARRFHADGSVLVVIDTQPGFLDKLSEDEASAVVDRIRWLCRLAGWLSVPVVITEEEPGRNGETVAPVKEGLPPGTVRHLKPAFDLAACPEILADLVQHDPKAVVLCGLETDVCVAQSALGLADAGMRVVVVEDAVASAGAAHAQGLARLTRAGVELIGVKGLGYEWLETVERANDFAIASERDAPAGLVL